MPPKHQGVERLGKPEFPEMRGDWKEMPSRGNVESWIAAWDRTGHQCSWKRRRQGAWSPHHLAEGHQDLLLFPRSVQILSFSTCATWDRSSTRLKARPMANLSINPPASILQTGRRPRAASEISDPNQAGVCVFWADPHTCGLQFGPGFIFRRQPRTY